jgi:hypothetical protein
MSFQNIQITTNSTPPRHTFTVKAETCITSGGIPATLIIGATTIHEIRVANRLQGQRLFFTLTSVLDGAAAEYDQSGGQTWACEEFPVDPPRTGLWVRSAKAQRTRALTHPGSCTPGNGHTADVRVSIRGANPEEALPNGGETSYQFVCNA